MGLQCREYAGQSLTFTLINHPFLIVLLWMGFVLLEYKFPSKMMVGKQTPLKHLTVTLSVLLAFHHRQFNFVFEWKAPHLNTLSAKWKFIKKIALSSEEQYIHLCGRGEIQNPVKVRFLKSLHICSSEPREEMSAGISSLNQPFSVNEALQHTVIRQVHWMISNKRIFEDSQVCRWSNALDLGFTACLVFFNGISTFMVLFNAETIFVREQSWYHVTNSKEDKEVHTFPKDIFLPNSTSNVR